MLVLMRRPNETIVCTLEDGRRIEITIVAVEHNKRVRVGITAPKSIAIDRSEIDERKRLGLEPLEINGNH